MPQHLAVRVPWHDNGWNGTICQNPAENSACLVIKKIADRRDDVFECNCSGCAIKNGNFKVPCAKINGRFMSKNDLMMEVEHPQKWGDKEHYGHLLKTPVTFPAYSFACTPYRWLLKNNIEKIYREVKAFDPVRELENTTSNWIMDGENQRAVFDHFFHDVLPEKSLVVAYAQRVPFYEGKRRVIIGVGHIRKVINANEFNTDNAQKPSAMTWETMVCHSIRDDHRDGFLIPYQQIEQSFVQMAQSFFADKLGGWAIENRCW